MATTNEVELLKFTSDLGDIQQKLKDLEAQLRKIGKAEEEVVDTQKKGNTELLTASQKRKAALTSEQAELKKLQAGLKGAFTVSDIEKFNKAIAKSKDNIKLLKGETDLVGKGIGGLKSQFGALGAGIAAAFTVQSVIEFGKQSVQAFREAEINANKLKFAVVNIAGEGIPVFEKLIAQSQRLQKITIFSDDDIQRAQTQLLQFGLTGDEVERLIPKILDLASATGKDLAGATDTLIQGINGQSRALKPLGLEFKNTGDKAENLAIITEKLNKFTGASSVLLDSSAGSAVNLANKIDELKEKIGESIAKSKFFTEFQAFITKFVESFTTLDELAQESTNKRIAGLKATIEEGIKPQIEAQQKLAGVFVTTQIKIDAIESSIADKEKARNEFRAQQADVLSTLSNDDLNKRQQKLRLFETEIANEKELLLAEKEKKVLADDSNKDAIKKIQDSIRLGILNKELLVVKQQLENPALTKLQTTALQEQLVALKELIKVKGTNLGKTDEQIAKEEAARLAAIQKTAEAEKKANDKRLEDANRIAGAIKEGNVKIQDDATKQVEANAKVTLKSNEQLIKDQQALNLAAAQQNLDADKDFQDQKTENEKKAIAEREALNQQAQQAAIQAANAIADAIFQIQQNNLERSQKAETEALQTEKEKALSNKRLTEAQKDQINKEFAAKELILAKKQFEEKKRLSISQAIIQGALAVVSALATANDIYAGLILAGLVAVTTASEIAVIESQKFAKGKRENQKGGPSYVGEQGKEFMYVPDNAMIVDARKTNRHKALINAMMDGNLDDYLEKSFVLPRLQSHLKSFETNKEKSFSNNVAKALIYHGLTPLQAEKIRRKGITINNADVIIEGIVNGLKNVNDPRKRI